LNAPAKNLAELLAAAGYVKSEEKSDIVWSARTRSTDEPIRAKCDILERKGQFHLQKITVQIKYTALKPTLIQNLQARFPRMREHYLQIESDGRIRCVIDISPPRQNHAAESARLKPEHADRLQNTPSIPIGTVIGFTLALEGIGSKISAQITDCFFLGDGIDHWYADICAAIFATIAPGREKSWDYKHLGELTFPLAAITSSASDNSRKVGKSGHRPFGDLVMPHFVKTSFIDDKLQIETTSEKPAVIPPATTEILEARETSSLWQSIDEAIGRRKKPKRSMIKSDSVDLLARIAAAPSLANDDKVDAKIEIPEDGQDFQLIFSTGALQLARIRDNNQSVLNITSDIIRKATHIYGDASKCGPIRRIAAETLGDCWSAIDPAMAFKSWSTATRGSHAKQRVLHKIAALARATNNFNVEIDALVSLATIERRRDLASKIANRLVEVIDERFTENPELSTRVSAALDSLSSVIPDHGKLLSLSARGALRQGQIKKALVMIERYLSNPPSQPDYMDISRLNALMAEIWHEHEHKPILATQRFVAATTPPAKPNQMVLLKAERFFEETNNRQELERILKIRANTTTGETRVEALEKSARYYIDHGRYQSAAMEIIQLIEVGTKPRQWYLDILLHTDQMESAIVSRLSAAMLNADIVSLPADQVPVWIAATSRLALDYSATRKNAAEKMLDPEVIKILNSDDCRKLTSVLAAENLGNDLHNASKIIITSGKKIDAEHFADLIIRTPLTSPDGLFENFIAETAQAARAPDLIIRYLESLARSGNLKSLTTLFRATLTAFAGSTSLHVVLDDYLSALLKSKGDLSDLITYVYTERVSAAKYTGQRVKELFSEFIRRGFLSLATEILRESIADQAPCATDEILVSELLSSDPQSLAQWYLSRPGNPDEKIHNLRSVINLWLRTDDRPVEMLRALEELSTAAMLDDNEIALAELLATAHAGTDSFVRILTSQIQNNERKNHQDLIHLGLRYINSRVRDPRIALDKFLIWSKTWCDSPVYHNFTLAKLHKNNDDAGAAQKVLYRLLENPEIIRDEAITIACVEMLAGLRPDKSKFSVVFQTLNSWAKAAGNTGLINELKRAGIDLDLAGIDEMKTEFITRFPDDPIESLARLCARIITRANKFPDGPKNLVNEWLASPIISARKEKWWGLVQFLTSPDFSSNLRRASRRELNYAWAMALISNDNRRMEAIRPLQVMFDDDPADHRSWIPLYTLYEESGNRERLIALLDRVIPYLEKDDSPLEKTPFNIEILRTTLNRLRRATSSPMTGFQNQETSTSSNIKIQAHQIERLQAAWIGSLPPVQFDPSESGTTSDTDSARDISALSENSSTSLSVRGVTDNSGQFAVIVDTQPLHASEVSETYTSDSDGPIASDFKWRDAVNELSVPSGATDRILTTAFAQETEKHVAAQCLALLSGEMSALENWHWPVWRNSGAFDYPVSPAGRLSRNQKFKFYDQSIHKVIRLLMPFLLRKFRDKFLIEKRLQSLGVSGKPTIIEVAADHPAIQRGPFRMFTSFINDLKLRLADTHGLGAEVFLDLRTRTIHFDAKWQITLPPGVLAYRVFEIVNQTQRSNEGIASLDAVTDIKPVIDDIREILTSSGLTRLKIAFGIEKGELHDFLKSVNREALISSLNQCVGVTASDITRLQTEIRVKSLSTILASTLDVVGITESLAGRSLSDPGVLKHRQVQLQHPLVSELLKVAADLIF
jgi:tetratricopeptide (TPR) repeat protein